MSSQELWLEGVAAVEELARRGGLAMSDADRALLHLDAKDGEVDWSGGVRERLGVPDSMDVYVEVHAPHLSDVERARLCYITRAVFYGFFDAATDGLPLTDTNKIEECFGASLSDNYVEANATFMRLATTYWTFKVLFVELSASKPHAALTRLMHVVDGEIYPLFFPYEGPTSIDPERRAKDQRVFLSKFAPRIRIDELLDGNPILIRERKRRHSGRRFEDPVAPRKTPGWPDLGSCLSMLLIVAVVFAGLSFWVPWWGALLLSSVLYAALFTINQHIALKRSSRTIARAYATLRSAGRSHPNALQVALETRFLRDETRARVWLQFQAAINEAGTRDEREQLKTLIRLMFWEEHGVPPDEGTQIEFERNLEAAVERVFGKPTRTGAPVGADAAQDDVDGEAQILRRNLIGRVGGDQQKLERLIAYERSRSPFADEVQLLKDVRASLERDLR